MIPNHTNGTSVAHIDYNQFINLNNEGDYTQNQFDINNDYANIENFNWNQQLHLNVHVIESLQQQPVDFQTKNNVNAGHQIKQLIATHIDAADPIFGDYTPTNSSQTITSVIEITANNSDASTVENDENELQNTEGPFQHLSGLNSDNLMQFSQQSILQDMMLKEQLDKKPNLNILPTFEEHDIGGYNFELRLSNIKKYGMIYSDRLKKIYLKRNETLSIDAIYKTKLPLQQLRLRALLCYHKEVSEPVLRCQNHMTEDSEKNPKIRNYMLRCENPSTEYCGNANGKSINERFSILLPLNSNFIQEDKSVLNTILLKFTCQNSCLGRKETAIVFLLEGMNGEILSQRVLNVKVCSCPKRDKRFDENHLDRVAKRKIKMEGVDDDSYMNNAKIRKQDSSSGDENNLDDFTKKYDIQPTANGRYRLVMEMDSKEFALKSIDFHIGLVANKICAQKNPSKRSTKNYWNLKRLYDKTQKLQ